MSNPSANPTSNPLSLQPPLTQQMLPSPMQQHPGMLCTPQPAVSLSEGFYMQMERERAASERAERERSAERERGAERERSAERFALAALACATVASVACAVLFTQSRRNLR